MYRIHYITYPDKERVYYSYDKGGNLQNIRGEKQNQPTVYYIKDIKYDYYGQKIYELNGNGILTEYKYNIENRRLEQLINYNINTPNNILQSNAYTYDNVGNVIEIKDNGCNQK